MGSALPPPIENRELLESAMGGWPSFHDAQVLSVSYNGSQCDLLIHVFRMTDQIDHQGYFVLTDYHQVRLQMIGISTCTLPANYDGDTLFGLQIGADKDSITIELESVLGQSWHIRCQRLKVSDVFPCGPHGGLPI